MSAVDPQVIDSQEFIDVLDYQFTGDSATVENKRRIVEGYRLKASIYHAAQFAGVHRATVYRYMANDPQFVAAMEDAHEDSADEMETSTYEDALGRDGKRGDPILKMFWLKAHRPKFRDRVTLDIPAMHSELQTRMQRRLSSGQLPNELPNELSVQSPLTDASAKNDDSNSD